MNSTNSNFVDVPTKAEIQDKKQTLRVYKRKYESYASEFRDRLGLPQDGQRLWSMAQVDLDDPKVSDLKADFKQLLVKIHALQWEIEKDEAIIKGTLPEYYATRKAYSFLDSQEDGGIMFLQEHHLTTHALIYEIMRNPNFIEERTGMQWLPVVKVDDGIFVKTIRGIEPVRKANLKCENIDVGDYALCKSIHNALFIFDYCKEEVMA